MEENYSIDEILSAVDDLQNLKRKKTKKVFNVSNAKTDNSAIPKNTLKFIEEADKSNHSIKPAICIVVSHILLEKPHSLSYHESTRLNFPFIT